MSAETINNLATVPLLAGGFFAALCFLVVFVGSPWYRSGLGITFLGILLGATIVAVVPALRRVFGEYAGYEWVAVACYSAYALAWLGLFLVVLVERRRSDFIVLPVSRPKE